MLSSKHLTGRSLPQEAEPKPLIDSPANIAGKLLTPDSYSEMDSEELGSYFEKNWSSAAGRAQAMAYLMREMKRRFKIRDRHKKPDGTYVTIRGFTSFEKWFVHATGKSVRTAYYLLKRENQKHKRTSKDVVLKLRVTPDQYRDFQRAANTRKVSVEAWAVNLLITGGA